MQVHRAMPSSAANSSAPTAALERVKGIEPSYAAWEAAVLPLNYTRGRADCSVRHGAAAASGVELVARCRRDTQRALDLVYASHALRDFDRVALFDAGLEDAG